MARVTIAALSTENAQLRKLLADAITEVEQFKHQAKCDRRTILMLKSQAAPAAPARAVVGTHADAVKRYFAANPGAKTVSYADLKAFAAG